MVNNHGQASGPRPLTESGFVRVSSNRRAIAAARTIEETIAMLRTWRQQPGHTLWADDVSLATCAEIDLRLITGYRQVTNAHLLALAIRRQGRLVTFDRAAASLAPSPDHVVVLAA
jgi:toxin-antitoxin system PIN domain toxin